MPRSYFWILYFHLVAASLLQGGMVFFSFLLAHLRRRLAPEEFAGEAISIIRFYQPFILLCVVALILTGAWYLTGLKAAMGPSFGRLFVPLGLKLAGVFLLVMVASFQFFGLGLRLTRGTGPAGNGRPLIESTEERLKLLRAVERVNLANIAIGFFIIYFGLVLGKGF